MKGHLTGGVAYNLAALNSIASEHITEVPRAFVRREAESLPAYALRVVRLKPRADILIKDPMVLSFNKAEGLKLSIGMIHHIDYHRMRSSLRHRLYLRNLERRMLGAGRIVVVSEYWKKYIEGKGGRDVRVIHNSFDVSEFESVREEVNDFRLRYGLDGNRPLIYLGMASVDKGFDRVMKLVEGLPFQFLATGEWQGALPSNIQVHRLSRKDYLQMLSSADATLTMPSIPEGWSRVAHESLLSLTPVVGIESGGMTALLEHSGQIILRKESELQAALERAMNERENLGRSGFEYVRQFDQDYFRKAWLEAVEV